MPDITFISMTYNRSDDRIGNQIKTLLENGVNNRNIIIVNGSPDGYHHANVQKQCARYNVVYKHCVTGKMNKPRCLNIGIRQSVTKYTACIDIDIMFAPGFVDELMKRLEQDNTMVLAVCGYLPEMRSNYLRRPWHLLKESIIREKLARKWSPGAVQATRTDWFKRVRGFDEAFVGLGGMDDDLIHRARMYGLNIDWIEYDDAQCYHQWHPISDLKNTTGLNFLELEGVVRNDEKWGRC